jgi:hypothetical protein
MKLKKSTSLLFFFFIVCSQIFAENDFVSGIDILYIKDFYVFSGVNSDRERLLANNFDLPEFTPGSKGQLVNKNVGDNYHAFKTFFSISDV